MEFIYAIGVLLNVLRNVVKVNPAVEELFEQVCEQVYRVKCTIVDLEAEVARLKAENEGLQHTGPAECKGEIVFWPGDSTKKICAIKALRGIFGMGLKEAKELVESGRCPKPVNMGLENAVVAVLEINGYVVEKKWY